MEERGKATNAKNEHARRSKLPSCHHAPSSVLSPNHDYLSMATKRSASPTFSSSPSASPSHKSARIVSDARELVCSLPPTCSRNGGTRLQGTRELEAHYAKFHAHVCSAPGCECIFPEARLLELVIILRLSQICPD